jgi:hypothetical protein
MILRNGTLARTLISVWTVWNVILGTGFASSGTVNVSGIVSTLDYGKPARVRGAIVVFQSIGAESVKVVTNEIGNYTASLMPDRDYTVQVTESGFCPVHRPTFRPIRDSRLKFDFTVTTMCPRDRIAVGSLEAYFSSPVPYYFEEKVSLGEDVGADSIISFGARRKIDNWVRYGPLRIVHHEHITIPVTVSFGTYTVKADEGLFDVAKKVLRAEGNVSVADGGASPPKRVACVTISVYKNTFRADACKTGAVKN